MSQNFTADCMLVPLPCGCTTDVGEIRASAPEQEQQLLECPWCEATFSRDDFRDWMRSEFSPQLFMHRPPRTLVKYAGKLLEALGRCDCDEPLVREPGGPKFHLEELGEGTPEVVRN